MLTAHKIGLRAWLIVQLLRPMRERCPWTTHCALSFMPTTETKQLSGAKSVIYIFLNQKGHGIHNKSRFLTIAALQGGRMFYELEKNSESDS